MNVIMKLPNLETRLIKHRRKEPVFYESLPTKAKSLGWLDPTFPAIIGVNKNILLILFNDAL